ncbi:acyl-CoA dehydrogenase family protein [Nocardia sp. CA-084685]|uniref:acyl-CoA dehydrogenase family protein n=1 Tax=Nocardia sp. CA-084685 TaxID=3239970 RepID=UPI003D9932C2
MNEIRLSADDVDAVRVQLLEWVTAHWDPNMPLEHWRARLAEAGWAAPSWPRRWGGLDMPAWADEVVVGELLRLGTVGTPIGVGVSLAAPTILAHGSADLCERFLRPILTGQERWCQLFSEPEAGSDLAGVTTTAVLDGDDWVVNGHKVWNTSAQHADLGMLLVRTDANVPAHQGISYLILPMHQPGVTIRPLRQMNDHSSFNEVFLNDARVPRDFVLGGVGKGWATALTTLAHERRFSTLRPPKYADKPGRTLAEARRETQQHFATYRWYPQRAGRADLIVEHARRTGGFDDPLIRQEIAAVLTLERISTWTAARAKAARARGKQPGPEGSVGKLTASRLARAASHAHTSIAGASALLSGPEAPFEGTIAEILLSTPAQSIAGGTDEIQKNILAEKILGLAREPAPDRDRPVNQTRRTLRHPSQHRPLEGS